MWNNKKIDLVYTWVDGSDKEFIKKKNYYAQQFREKLDPYYHKEFDNEIAGIQRFYDNEELKFSVRSVERFAPWFNNIFIITDNQIPKWLNTDNKKIHIIDHSQIMPKSALPCFNSNSIEFCICNIPNLSEYYVYGNDDFFFGRFTKSNFFYNKSGLPYYRTWNKAISKKTNSRGDYQSIYDQRHYNSIELINKQFGMYINLFHYHNFCAYKKSVVKDCIKFFPEEISSSVHNKFRSRNEYSRILLDLYACATGEGCHKIDGDSFIFCNKFIQNNISNNQISSEKTLKRRKDKTRFYSSLNNSLWRFLSIFNIGLRQSFYSECPDYKLQHIVKMVKPNVFCVNDTQGNAQYNKDFLQLMLSLFPNKSEYEL